MTTRTSPADVERLCKLMVAHNLVELEVGDVHLRRAGELAPPKASAETDLERLQRMSPDQVERALLLSRVGPGGG